MKRVLLALALLLLALLTPSFLRSDALVITRAMLATTISEVFIEEDSVVVELEIGARDIAAFRNLLPDQIYERLGYEAEPWIDRLLRFVREDLVIRADDGPPIAGRLTELEPGSRVQRDQVTGEPLPVQPEDAERVIRARLVYPLRGRPGSVTIAPPRIEPGASGASVGFVAYHRGLHVNDFRYLGQPERLVLNWDDPWYSQFENRNLWRQFRAPISAYLYIEPFEVRKEIVARPKDLQQWVDLGLDGKENIAVDEQEEIKRRVTEFLADRSPVTIDGQPAEGFVDRIHFIYRSLRTSGVIQPPRDLETISATLGIIFVYPTDGLPDEVEMRWDLFTERISLVPGSATDEAGSLPYYLSADDPVLRWENFLTNPTVPGLVEVEEPPGERPLLLALGWVAGAGILALLLLYGRKALRGERRARRMVAVAAGLALAVGVVHWIAFRGSRLSENDTRSVLTGLLLNIYKSFDYRDEQVIYDALERSTSGELLTDVYLETRRSLELANQGGARAKVKSVEVLAATNQPLSGEQGFSTRAVWNVAGSVGHWGHVHQRVNQYEADLRVEVVDGAWKITDLDVLQEERLLAPGGLPPPAPSGTSPGAGGP